MRPSEHPQSDLGAFFAPVQPAWWGYGLMRGLCKVCPPLAGRRSGVPSLPLGVVVRRRRGCL
jgi:hypothetical protein